MKRFLVGMVLWGCNLGCGCASGWVVEDSSTQEDLLGVCSADGKDVFVVGRDGTVLRRQGNQWRRLESNTFARLNSCYSAEKDHVIVVGDGCTALSLDTSDPQKPILKPVTVRDCNGENLLRIFGRTKTDAHVVKGNRILNFNGSQISGSDSCGQDALLGVHTTADGKLVAVGEHGSFCERTGGKWKTYLARACQAALEDGKCPCPEDLVDGLCPVKVPFTPTLWDAWIGDDGNGGAVGSYGGLWVFPFSGDWFPVESGVDVDLHAVSGWIDSNKTNHLVIVGERGVFFHFDQGKFSREVVGTKEDLWDVWIASDGGEIYTVGNRGTINHLAR